MKEYAQLKLELAKEYYNNTCPICKKLFDEYHLPVFHHLWYEGDNDAKYNMFGNKEQYLQALAYWIIDNPKRFKAVHSDCHQIITKLMWYGNDKLKRALKIVRMTK